LQIGESEIEFDHCFRQQLQCNASIELRVVREVHFARTGGAPGGHLGSIKQTCLGATPSVLSIYF